MVGQHPFQGIYYRYMAIIKKNRRDEYIVVHHVFGESDVLDFLRMTSHTILDRLCFEAKTTGKATFSYKSRMYCMTRDKDTTYIVEQIEETAGYDIG